MLINSSIFAAAMPVVTKLIQASEGTADLTEKPSADGMWSLIIMPASSKLELYL